MSEALLTLADRMAITELIHTYCRAVDRLDVPLGESVWHADSHADYGAFYQGPGRAVIARICESHRSLISHSHQVANVLIELAGDEAGSEAYFTGSMRLQRDGRLLQMGVWGRYCDRWERREGRWGIVRRTVVYDHEEIREVVPMGTPTNAARDGSDPSYAALLARRWGEPVR